MSANEALNATWSNWDFVGVGDGRMDFVLVLQFCFFCVKALPSHYVYARGRTASASLTKSLWPVCIASCAHWDKVVAVMALPCVGLSAPLCRPCAPSSPRICTRYLRNRGGVSDTLLSYSPLDITVFTFCEKIIESVVTATLFML